MGYIHQFWLKSEELKIYLVAFHGPKLFAEASTDLFYCPNKLFRLFRTAYTTELISVAEWVKLSPGCLRFTRVILRPNPTTDGSRLIFSVPFFYFLFIFYLPRCTVNEIMFTYYFYERVNTDYGVGYVSALDISATGLSGTRTFFFRFVFL